VHKIALPRQLWDGGFVNDSNHARTSETLALLCRFSKKIGNVIGYQKFTSMLFLLGSVLKAGGFRRDGIERKSGRNKCWSRSA
jgi:hypothetical protein